MYSHEILVLRDLKTAGRVGICVAALKGEVLVVRMRLNVGVVSPIRTTAGVCNPPTIVSIDTGELHCACRVLYCRLACNYFMQL